MTAASLNFNFCVTRRHAVTFYPQKLATKYKEDATRFEFLNDMILYERAQGGKGTAVDALLWLRR